MERLIKILEGTNVEIDKMTVKVSGKNGNIEKNFDSPLFRDEIKIEKAEGNIKIISTDRNKKIKAMAGTIDAIIKNMMAGVAKGFTYKLKIIYIHFPITVKVAGKQVVITNFLGERAPRRAEIIGDTKVEVKGDEIIVTGANKEEVSQTAANIERATWIKARDRRVYQDGCFVVSRG